MFVIVESNMFAMLRYSFDFLGGVRFFLNFGRGPIFLDFWVGSRFSRSLGGVRFFLIFWMGSGFSQKFTRGPVFRNRSRVRIFSGSRVGSGSGLYSTP